MQFFLKFIIFDSDVSNQNIRDERDEKERKTRTNCPYAATFLDVYSISPPIYIYIYISTYIHIYKYIYIYVYMFYSSIL